MAQGYLKVQVHTGSDALPVSGTHVRIKGRNGELLYDLVTDENGNTQKINLYAPDKYHTLDPSDLGPYYSEYDVEVVTDGDYIPVIIHGVQIFDGETSILPVEQEPIVEPNDRNEPIHIDIPPITGVQIPKYETNQEEPLGMRAPLDVIIPEYMTVHLGTPNAQANNVRVRFVDYIKNVASSEIFPTWPEAALEANIYAQISFALNRVFTVWYRSRGYGFDITNSTTVDQYFVYGRNIFENISRIVDNIFNMFIRRQGRQEPFFAQYCNGTTVTCAGLSQWGTVPLAERGYTPINILKYFYPDDIQIVQSTNFSSREGTYPGYPLYEGASGSDVRYIQNCLNRIAANYPLIPQISNPNGTFSSSTLNAVKVFQTSFNLPSDGIVGKQTWYAITRTFVGVARLAELDSEGIRIGIGASPPTTTVREGSRGENVVELQFLLNYIASFYPTIPYVIQDGSFGPSTKRSVIEFQKKFNLTPDGVVGPTTWNKLYDVYKAIQNATPSEPSPPGVPSPPYPGTALRVGSRGANVTLMQEYLNTISIAYPSIPRLTVDGIFGNNMQNAVFAFQRQFGLTVDGVIGKVTWDSIVTERNRVVTGQPSSPPYPGTSLRLGSSGANVTLMQRYLNAIAAVYTAIPRLVVDGIFGSRTQDAVIAFQRQFGLTQDGVIGMNTWTRIVEEYNKIIGNRFMAQMMMMSRVLMRM